ncbi:thiol:disulfide interchange protein DsbA/DsbL [Dyella sp.]|uniref:thiol:disulfide interchange protein DsbA/DsbL n=1 Tax=Dyella sp. TaxID=1869338 RepID=UPI002D7A097F|nr:thiol:disulfide interchange protein DsbA/DsbL [Dyella sp.]HET7330639.1 thiol:disulfide interchange protein DsbA/DsbL [Dyella sp.]
MIKRAMFCFSLLAFAGVAAAQAPVTSTDAKWVEGKNYFRVEPQQPTSVATGKIEVMEVFSYACPVCYRFLPYADKISKSLPPDAQMVYLPVSFNPAEDFPVFQRAFYAAQALGVEAKAHEAMFKAIHGPGGELATYDARTGRMKNPLPGIKDIAQFYAQYGVKPEVFVATANSFAVNMKMKRADAEVQALGVTGTPTMVVDGKWRYDMTSAGGPQQVVELTDYLINLERQAKKQ